MRRELSAQRMREDSEIDRDFLFDKVPVNRLAESFDYACDKQTSSFAPNAFDIKNAFREIEAKEKAAQIEADKLKASEVNPVDVCTNKKLHINARGWANYCNPFNFNEELPLPCHICRYKAHHNIRERYIKKHKTDIEPMRILETVVEAKPKPVEVRLSAEEIESLLTEHNSLVRQIVTDAEARLNLELVFDEGGNVFKLPHRADLLYSAVVVKRKIADYQRILEKN
jgi:hypothetical protein